MKRRSRYLFALLAGLLVCPSILVSIRATSAIAESSLASSYTIEDVGVLNGDDTSFAFAINQDGRVTGTSRNSTTGESRAFLFRDGKLRNRATDTTGSIGWAVNSSSQIAGFATIDETTSAAVLWNGSAFTLLPTLGGTSAQAFGINDDGIVVGGSPLTEGGPFQACTWENGTATALASLGGVSLASAINNRGQIVGSASASSDPVAPGSHATLWEGDTLIDLGTIAGPTSLARSINESGQIVGHTTTTADGQFGLAGTHAFLWQDGVMTDLGVLPGGTTSFAWDINNQAIVSGTADNPDPSADSVAKTVGVVWVAGKIVDLNELLPSDSGWVVTSAYGINDAGQIVGIGIINGQQHGYLLTPEKA